MVERGGKTEGLSTQLSKVENILVSTLFKKCQNNVIFLLSTLLLNSVSILTFFGTTSLLPSHFPIHKFFEHTFSYVLHVVEDVLRLHPNTRKQDEGGKGRMFPFFKAMTWNLSTSLPHTYPCPELSHQATTT